jgi:hypothetical protein
VNLPIPSFQTALAGFAPQDSVVLVQFPSVTHFLQSSHGATPLAFSKPGISEQFLDFVSQISLGSITPSPQRSRLPQFVLS